MLLSLYARINRFFDVCAHCSHNTIVTNPVFNEGVNKFGTNRALLSAGGSGRHRDTGFCGYDIGGVTERGIHSSICTSSFAILN